MGEIPLEPYEWPYISCEKLVVVCAIALTLFMVAVSLLVPMTIHCVNSTNACINTTNAVVFHICFNPVYNCNKPVGPYDNTLCKQDKRVY